MEKAQALAPHDPAEADPIGGEAERPAGVAGDCAHASSSPAPPVSRVKAAPIEFGAGRRDDRVGAVVGEHAPLVQHDDLVVGTDLVDEMRGPQHADAILRHEAAGQRQNVGPRLDVEPRGRLVEQHEAGFVQERAGDLDPPRLAARELADAVFQPVGKPHPSDEGAGAGAGLARGHALQRALIQHVLLDAEVGVERAALEHDAEFGERRAALPRHVVPEDADRARPAGVEMGDDGKERALARAVQAEQDGEGRRLN